MSIPGHPTVSRGPFQLGEWLVRPRDGTVSRGGEVKRLRPQAMDLLVRLARTPGETVLRDELLAELWPGVVVGEVAVSQCVSEIRAALGDSAAEQRVIRTVPKRGYALVAPVRSSGIEGLSGGSRAPARVAPARSARSAVRWLAAAAMALAVVGLAVWWGRSGAPESAARREPTIVMPSFARVDPSDEETRWLSTGLAHLLASEISSLSRAKVISAHGLLESNARMEGPPGESIVVKLRAASIDYLIVGSYLVEGGGPDVRIDVAIFDPERNEAVAVFTEVAEIAHLSAGVGRLAARMIEALGIEGSPPTSRAALD